MLHLSDLLDAIPLPAAETSPTRPRPLGSRASNLSLMHDLGADLPAGHMHVWGGPPGAGKTSFLLSLLHDAAAQGRRVVYATYDLPAETLAMRLLAMVAGIEVDRLPDPGGPTSAGGLAPDELTRAQRVRSSLSGLPFSFLQARGFTTASLSDRLVRMPFRPEVLAVDYLQGVIREPGTDLGVALRSMSDLAAHLHVAVVCAMRAAHDGADSVSPTGNSLVGLGNGIPDRVGWLGPVEAGRHARSDVIQAEVIHNRHGNQAAMPLRLDEASTAFRPVDPS